jgi:alkylation response protein AidB-like acyl-CoA dehydrogenase
MVLCGGNGVIVENDIERYLRDAKMKRHRLFALPHITDMIADLL